MNGAAFDYTPLANLRKACAGGGNSTATSASTA